MATAKTQPRTKLLLLNAALLLIVHTMCADGRMLKRASAEIERKLNNIAVKMDRMDTQTGLPTITSRQTMQDVQSYGRRACDLVNSIRAQYGLHSLWYSGTLTDRAFAHSQWMASYNYFTHQNLGSIAFYVYDRTYAVNRYMQATGENIATSVHRSSDVANDFHWQWVYSPPHFQNMLSTAHSHCGTGFAYDARTGVWWATQLFGRGDFGHEYGGQTPA